MDTIDAGSETPENLLRHQQNLLEQIKGDADYDYENRLRSLTSGVEHYDPDALSKVFTPGKEGELRGLSALRRQRGSLKITTGTMEIWIEWRPRRITRDSFQEKECRVRAEILAQMLRTFKTPDSCLPKCIGFIDDCADNNRYGLIFEMSPSSDTHSSWKTLRSLLGQEGYKPTLRQRISLVWKLACSLFSVHTIGWLPSSDTHSSLKTLHSLLGEEEYKPTLRQRITLAWKLASSVFSVHAIDWLHNRLNSDSIIFEFHDKRFDAEKPILSGFEYPLSGTGQWIPNKWDIYRWPGIQGETLPIQNCRKIFDIYSLGLVLLEVAHWRPLHQIMCLKRWPVPSSQDARIRAWLLKDEHFPPFGDADPIGELKDIAGEKYWEATCRCITSYGEMGMGIDADNDSNESQGGTQDEFRRLVVEELEGALDQIQERNA